jgi:tRNA threonylcarbamoyladenosine biosynthesis protein TsaE
MPTDNIISTHSVEETKQKAVEFAASLKSGELILLHGDLGAGKTAFVQGLVKGLGSDEEVTSPTFTLQHEYIAGKFPVYHWDLYRLDETTDWAVLDLLDPMKQDGVTLIEWPERYPHVWPQDTIQIFIKITGEQDREITVTK